MKEPEQLPDDWTKVGEQYFKQLVSGAGAGVYYAGVIVRQARHVTVGDVVVDVNSESPMAWRIQADSASPETSAQYFDDPVAAIVWYELNKSEV